MYANTQPKSVAHGLASFKQIIALYGTANGDLVMPLAFPDSVQNSNWGVGLTINGTNVNIYTGMLIGLTDAVIVVEFTKP